MYGVIPIVSDSYSRASLNNNKSFIPFDSSLNEQYGGCSLVAEREVVVLVARVRFSPSAWKRESNGRVRLCEVCKNRTDRKCETFSGLQTQRGEK